jgi:hypothetical protein
MMLSDNDVFVPAEFESKIDPLFKSSEPGRDDKWSKKKAHNKRLKRLFFKQAHAGGLPSMPVMIPTETGA